MEQITKDLSDLTTNINNNDIDCTDIDIIILGDKVNTLQDLIPMRIASIEKADKEPSLPTLAHSRYQDTLAPSARTSSPLKTI